MNTTKITLHISGMHCTSCALNIDFDVEDIDGVKESHTEYAKQISTIQFDSQKTTVPHIISVIKKLGYTAKEA